MVQKPVMNNVQKGTGQREVRPVWNNALRTNHQNFSNSRRNFAPTTVLTKSGIVPISTARQSSSRAATPLSAARPINVAKTKPNVFQKAHSLSRRPFNQQTALNNKSLNNKVNTAKVNYVNTAKGKRVTSVVGEQGINAGDPQVSLKDTWIFDSGCSVRVIKETEYLSLVVPLTKVGDEVVHKELGDRMERAATTVSSLEAEQDSVVVQVPRYHIGDIDAQLEIFEQLALMGYETNSDKLTFQKGNFSPQWRFFIHTILHCLSPKKTAWEQFSSNIATAIICLATTRTFNFSKFIFDAMVKNLDNPHKFLMYPRFIQICLNKQRRLLQPHTRTYSTHVLTQKVFSNMKRVTKGYSGEDIPLFASMITASETSPSRITSSPSLSPQHTPFTAPFTSQPSNIHTTPVTEEAAYMPHESPLQSVHSLRRGEGSLSLHELTILCTKFSNKVGDEAVHKELGDRMERAATTASSFNTEQDSEPTELSEEDLKEMLEIVPVEEIKAEALQVKYPIVDWEVHTKGSRKYWKIIRVGNITEAYQGFEDMLKGFNKEDLDTLWSLVKGRFRPAEPSEDMEKALWVKLKRLFESDKDDVLWKLQRYMHDPLTWRLYGSSGVHHVSSTRGQDIFMLVEKDYPLTKGLAILMLSNKLRVD
ncbi:hypothetical protein Tco_1044835 [Tanacetum coccineum]|uniref:Uncharacterized protein n=1 Tax=Tanacetum coccineum TaxID=301880 RepID=A0ABQ5GR26_9ASTR